MKLKLFQSALYCVEEGKKGTAAQRKEGATTIWRGEARVLLGD
jgi:hypothetical protein